MAVGPTLPPPCADPLPFGAGAIDPAGKVWRISDGRTIAADICPFGASLVSVWVRDRAGIIRDVVLGCDTITAYRQQRAYLGAVIGRFANRIGGARFSLDGHAHTLSANAGTHTLHGGASGLDQAVWQRVTHGPTHLTLQHHSPDGDQGFPGSLRVSLTFALGPGPCLGLAFAATTDAPTPVNLTHHGYFNLSDAPTVADHRLTVLADQVLEPGPDLIPTGRLLPVQDTALDFRSPTRLAERWHSPGPLFTHSQGLDHCFVRPSPAKFGPVARLEAPDGQLSLRIDTDAIGLQVYASQHLDGTIIGKHGIGYGAGAGICLEPQGLPDSPNRPEFPPPWLRPGATYRTRTAYVFEP